MGSSSYRWRVETPRVLDVGLFHGSRRWEVFGVDSGRWCFFFQVTGKMK